MSDSPRDRDTGVADAGPVNGGPAPERPSATSTAAETDAADSDMAADADTIVALFLDSLKARFAVGRRTIELAAAEARLALFSIVLLVAALLLVVALLLVSWLLLLTLVAIGLQAMGWSPLASIISLLTAHLIALVALALWIARLTRRVGFRHTREALRRRRTMQDAAA